MNEKTTVRFIQAVLVLIFLTAVLTSCATNGYGCKGRSKLITRVPQ